MLWTLPEWSALSWFTLLIGGVACGFINTLAGGGSFITLPLLIYLGMTPLIANATNRLALVIQTATAAAGYWHAGERDLHTVLWLAGPGLLGSACGALLAVHLDPTLFRTLFGTLLIMAVIPVLHRPKLFQKPPTTHAPTKPTRPRWTLIISFFFVGIYSGFLQVGIGVWSLLLLLLLGNFQVNHANAIKSQLLALTTAIATVIFLWNDQVVLIVSLSLALGNATGAWLATRLARNRELPWLKWLILCGALAASLKLFGLV